MNRNHRRPLAALLGILLLTGPGCNSNSSPLVPVPSAAPSAAAQVPVTMRVTVPDGTASLDVRATVGDLTVNRTVTTFSAAALRIKAVATVALDLPAGRATLQFTARDPQGRQLAENTTTADISSGNNALDVVLSPGSASPVPTASPTPGSSASPSPGASASSSVPTFLAGPSPTPGASASASPSPGASASASPSASASVSPSPSTSPSPSASASASASPSPTPTPGPSANAGVIETLAGSTAGFQDGTGIDAMFTTPSGLAVDVSGNIYVAEYGSNAVRRLTPGGAVTTLAGNGSVGYIEGTGSGAVFNQPIGAAVDQNGNIVVADCNNHRIRRITTAGVTSLIAGAGGTGLANGTGAAASFSSPQGVAVDRTNGTIYVADTDNNAIRKITAGGVVTTLAGNGTADLVDGTGADARFRQPVGIALDASGNLLVADSNNHAVRKVTPAGVVTTLAGGGDPGLLEGTGTNAHFNSPYGITVDADGSIYVADGANNRVRKVTPDGVVTTLAGKGVAGRGDGTGTNARFNLPFGVVADGVGNLYISDSVNNLIRLSR